MLDTVSPHSLFTCYFSRLWTWLTFKEFPEYWHGLYRIYW